MRYSLLALIFILIGCKKNDQGTPIQEIVLNDTLTGKGQLIDSLEIGYWKYYNSEKRLIGISEYKIVNNKSYLNQEITFDALGDTIYEKSSYFTFSFREDNKVDIKFKKLFNEDSYSFFLYSNNIDSDFRNVDNIKLDTIYFKGDRITVELQNNNLRGLIKEIKFTSDSTFMDRDIYVDINKKSKDISTVVKK